MISHIFFQTQFIIVCIHSSQLLFIDCQYPGIFVFAIAFYQFLFLILFSNFYRKSYLKSKKTSPAAVHKNGAAISNGSLKNGCTSNGVHMNGTAVDNSYQNGNANHDKCD